MFAKIKKAILILSTFKANVNQFDALEGNIKKKKI